MNDHPFFFITRCMFCKAEISRKEDLTLKVDTFSDGLCKPLCEPGKKSGWSKYVPKEDGGEL